MGDFANSSGYLNFTPAVWDPKEMIDELATIMTAGRLSSDNRLVIEDAVKNETDANLAAVKVRQLLLSTAEFHTTGTVTKTTGTRTAEDNSSTEPSSSAYKAVVYVMLKGGADTYNFIVPHTCPQLDNIRDQYNSGKSGRADNIFVLRSNQTHALFLF
jgi:hypothetical protein